MIMAKPGTFFVRVLAGSLTGAMKQQQINRELEEAARQLGFDVRFEKGAFRGGRCIVRERNVVMLNRRHPPEVHFAVLADSLRDLPLDAVKLAPAVRDALEEAWRRKAALPGSDDMAADVQA